ncbi:MAG: FGGY family carbohydrate kinase [Actinobacteria bacterium]|nr:FGGY family carbohydrate kinase [Actinomycetota bacterium]
MSLLGIDMGTTGCKAIVFDTYGKMLASSYKEYALIISKEGLVEYDPEQVLRSIKAIIIDVNSNPEVIKDPVEAFSLSVPGDEVLPANKDGKALYNMICSLDSRGIKENSIICEKIGVNKLYNITGLPPSNMYALNRILWFKSNAGKIYDSTYKFACWDSYIFKNLGFDFVSAYSVCSRTFAFDIINKRWSKEILNKLNVSENLFPKCLPSGEVLGILPKKLTDELGFKKKVYAVTGGFDQICAALGSGVIKKGRASVGTGTVECMQVFASSPITNDSMLKSSYPFSNHILKNSYVCLAINFGGGSLLKWFRNNLAYEEKLEVKKRKIDIYKLFDEKAAKSNHPLMVYPYFEGAQTPLNDPLAKGLMLGFSLGTQKEDIIRGILEGITYELRLNIDRLEKNGIKIDSLKASGGGAKSDFWLQLKADITGKLIQSLNVNEAGCLATSVIAGFGIGKYTTIEDTINEFVKVKKEYYPKKEKFEYYSKRFKLYKKIYPLISEFIKEI